MLRDDKHVDTNGSWIFFKLQACAHSQFGLSENFLRNTLIIFYTYINMQSIDAGTKCKRR